MTITYPLLYIVFLTAAFVTLFFLVLKKSKPSLIVLIVGSMIVSMLFLKRLFPLTIPPVLVTNPLKSPVPLKNIISAANIYIDNGSGTVVKINDLFEQLIVGLAMDFSMSLLICFGASFCFGKAKKVFAFCGLALGLVCVKLFLSALMVSSFPYDTIEIPVTALAACLGLMCGNALVTKKNN